MLIWLITAIDVTALKISLQPVSDAMPSYFLLQLQVQFVDILCTITISIDRGCWECLYLHHLRMNRSHTFLFLIHSLCSMFSSVMCLLFCTWTLHNFLITAVSCLHIACTYMCTWKTYFSHFSSPWQHRNSELSELYKLFLTCIHICTLLAHWVFLHLVSINIEH